MREKKLWLAFCIFSPLGGLHATEQIQRQKPTKRAASERPIFTLRSRHGDYNALDPAEREQGRKDPIQPQQQAQELQHYDTDDIHRGADSKTSEMLGVLQGNLRENFKQLYALAPPSERQDFTAFLERQTNQEVKALKNIACRAQELQQERQGFWGGVKFFFSKFYNPTARSNPYESAMLEHQYDSVGAGRKSLAFLINGLISFGGATLGKVVSGTTGILLGGLGLVAPSLAATLGTKVKEFGQYVESNLYGIVNWVLTADNPLINMGSTLKQTIAGGAMALAAAASVALAAEGFLAAGLFGGAAAAAGSFFAGGLGLGTYFLLKHLGFTSFQAVMGGATTTIITLYLLRRVLKSWYAKRKEEQATQKLQKTLPKGKKLKKNKIGRYYTENNERVYVQIF